MILRQMKNQNFVVPTGTAADDFRGMIRLNESGVYYWKKLEKGATKEELLADAAADFEKTDRATLEADLDEFIDSIRYALEDTEAE